MADLQYTVRLNGGAKATETKLSLGADKSVAALLAAAGYKPDAATVYFAGGVPVPGERLLSEFTAPLPVFCAGRSGISMQEVARHKSDAGSWMVLDAGRVFNAPTLGLQAWVVYDVTEYLDDHPGGKSIMMTNSGMDGSREYINVGHSQTARKLLSKYPLGVVAEADAQELASKAPAASAGGGGGALAYVLAGAALVALLAYLFGGFAGKQ